MYQKSKCFGLSDNIIVEVLKDSLLGLILNRSDNVYAVVACTKLTHLRGYRSHIAFDANVFVSSS